MELWVLQKEYQSLEPGCLKRIQSSRFDLILGIQSRICWNALREIIKRVTEFNIKGILGNYILSNIRLVNSLCKINLFKGRIIICTPKRSMQLF